MPYQKPFAPKRAIRLCIVIRPRDAKRTVIVRKSGFFRSECHKEEESTPDRCGQLLNNGRRQEATCLQLDIRWFYSYGITYRFSETMDWSANNTATICAYVRPSDTAYLKSLHKITVHITHKRTRFVYIITGDIHCEKLRLLCFSSLGPLRRKVCTRRDAKSPDERATQEE